jgi:hypothetical protein
LSLPVAVAAVQMAVAAVEQVAIELPQVLLLRLVLRLPLL